MPSFSRTSLKEQTARTLVLLAVVLIGISGFAQAIHVHPENSKLPSHECAICSVAHCGVIATAVYQPAPVKLSALINLAPDVMARASASVLALRIRPPPSV